MSTITLSLEDYNQLNFEEICNKADGNCFFESLSYLEVEDAKFHNMYRDRICNFLKGYKMATTIDLEQEVGQLLHEGNYKNLQTNKEGLKKLLAYHLKTSDDDIDEGCKDKVWAGDIHVIAACLLFNVNITLYILMNNSYTLDMFEVDPSRPTYNLKYYDPNHYEALIPAPVYTPPSPGDVTGDLMQFNGPVFASDKLRITRNKKDSKNKTKKNKEKKNPDKLITVKQIKEEKNKKIENQLEEWFGV